MQMFELFSGINEIQVTGNHYECALKWPKILKGRKVSLLEFFHPLPYGYILF